jgi:MFS family permease
MLRGKKYFSGWTIVFVTVISTTMIYGVRNSFSVFFPSILKEFGWSRGETAMMFSLNILMYGCVAPAAGILGDRLTPKRIMVIGLLILTMTTGACGLAYKLWHFYLLFGFVAPIGMALSGWPLLVPALTKWFISSRGLVLGLGQMGVGFSFAYASFMQIGINWLGWRVAYTIMAGTLIVILLPVYVFLFFHSPEERGLRAYGQKTDKAEPLKRLQSDLAVAQQPGNLPFWDLVKDYRLWLLVFSNLFYWGLGTYTVLAHQVKFTQDMGYSVAFTASVFGLFGLFMVIGQMCSWISDIIGREGAALIGNFLALCGLIALISIDRKSTSLNLYVYSVCFGIGAGLFSPTIYAGASDIFNIMNFGSVTGFILSGMGAGAAFGPWLGGYIYDLSGSYRPAFLLSLLCIALSAIMFVGARPGKARRVSCLGRKSLFFKDPSSCPDNVEDKTKTEKKEKERGIDTILGML